MQLFFMPWQGQYLQFLSQLGELRICRNQCGSRAHCQLRGKAICETKFINELQCCGRVGLLFGDLDRFNRTRYGLQRLGRFSADPRA